MDWNSDLNISSSTVQGRVPVTVIQVDGRVNLSNSDVLDQAAHQALDQGARHILLDLTNVPSLTSAGLRVIHHIYKMLNDAAPPAAPGEMGGKSPYLKLATASTHVRNVLQVAGFDTYIDTYDSAQEALSAF
jgi:anti-anti-sigma factor